MAVEGGSDYRQRLVRRKRKRDQEKMGLTNTRANAGPPSAKTFSTPAPKQEGGVSGAVKGFFLDWAEPATKVGLNALGSAVLGLSGAEGTTRFGGSATQMNRGTDPRVAQFLGDPATLGNRLTSAALEMAPVDEGAKASRRDLWAASPTASTYAIAASDFLPDPTPPGAAALLGSVVMGATKPINFGPLVDVITGPRKGVKGTKGPDAPPTDVSLVTDSTRQRLDQAVERGSLNPAVPEALSTPLPVVANIEDYTQRLNQQLGQAPVIGIPGKATIEDLKKHKGAIVVSTNKDGTISMATPPAFVDDNGVPHFAHSYPFGVRNAAGENWEKGMAGYYDESGRLLPDVAKQMEENLASVFMEASKRGVSKEEWYPFYNEVIVKDLSERTGIPEWNVAGGLAALSPQTPYPTNVADLVDLYDAFMRMTGSFNNDAGKRMIQSLTGKEKQIAEAGSPLKTGGQSGVQTLTGLKALGGLGTPADTQIGKTPSFQWANFDPLGNELRAPGGPDAPVIYFTTPEGVMIPAGQSTFDIMMARLQGGQVVAPGEGLPKGGLVQKGTGEFSEPLGLEATRWLGVSDIPRLVMERPEVAEEMRRRGFKGGTNTIQSEDWTMEQLMPAMLRYLLGYGGGYSMNKF